MLAEAWASASAFLSITPRSSPLRAVRRSETALSTLARSAPSTLSPRSLSDFSTAWISPSALLRELTSSRKRLSSSACASASRTMRLISSSFSPLEALMTIFCSLPVALSLADTLRMPFASMSKDTSICGMPRGAGAMSPTPNFPSDFLSPAPPPSPSPLSLALQVVDGRGRRAVIPRRECIRCLVRDGRVLLDQLVQDAAECLDAERQGGDVQQQPVLHSTGEHARLDGRAHRHRLVGVHVL